MITAAIFLILAGGTIVYIFSDVRPYEKAEVILNGNVITADVADTVAKRMKGLSDRKLISENEGMLFLFPYMDRHTFWMKGMKFPIDFLWIKGDRVVGFTRNADPQAGVSDFGLTAYSPPEPVDTVLELKAGSIERFRIREGDITTILTGEEF